MKDNTNKKISFSESLKNWVTIVAIVSGGFWAIVEFWYKADYLPSKLQPQVNISIDLEKLGKRDSLNVLRARVSTINAGPTRSNIVVIWYNASIHRIESQQAFDNKSYVQAVIDSLKGSRASRNLSRYVVDDKIEYISSGRLFGDLTFFDPEEEINKNLMIFAPGEYDFIEFSIEAFIAKNEDMLVYEWMVDKNGKLDAKLFLKLPGFEDDPSKREPFDWYGAKHQKIKKRDGIVYTSSVYRISFWD